MLFKVVILAVVSLSRAFQYSDLEALNKTCSPKDTCVVEKGPRLGLANDWKSRNCFCDNLCAQYGDCCLDAQAYNKEEQVASLDNYKCVNLKQFGDLYMKGKCSEGWADPEVAQLCVSHSPDSHIPRQDPLASMPVTSLATGDTYTNYYCAVCNNDSTEVEMWRSRLECPTLVSYEARFKNLTADFVISNLVFRNNNWGLHVEDNGVPVYHTCYMDPVMPETVGHLVRQCKQSINNCSANWTDTEVADLCRSYTAVVYNFDLAYRNVHCAMCNEVLDTAITCFYGVFTRSFLNNVFNPNSFALLFDFTDHSGSNVVGSSSTCGPGEVYDVFFSKCRNVVCAKDNHVYKFGRCVNNSTTTTIPPSSTSTSTTTSSWEDLNSTSTEEPSITVTSKSSNDSESTDKPQGLACEKFLLPSEEYEMSPNGTVVVEKYRRTYQAHEYELRDGGILVCIIQQETGKFSLLMGYVSLACLGLSCLCLVLHLLAFLVVPELRNLSGKNLASLCLALLAAYTIFILSVFAEPGKSECFILAAAMYYFFLASFCWMNIMALDIWRTLRMATSELRVSAGSQWVKFISYSVYSWLLPAAGLVAIVVLDLTRPAGMAPQYYPTLGQRWCWFGQRKALLVFFASPLTAIMVVNIVLFIMSARIIAETTQSTAKMTSCSPHQDQFKLYMRLALLMGLTWITGIVAAYLQLEPIWYVFVLLNTLQGLFIFLAFTCTRKVWHVAGSGCWRRLLLARHSAPWVARSPSSSRQGLESRDSHESHLSHSSVAHLTNASRTSVDAF